MVRQFNLGHFSDLSSIASGGEGEVSRGTHKNLGIVAVKTLFVPVSIDKLKELEILVDARNPRIVRLFGILVSYRDLTKCSGYVMELMEFGSLNSVIYDPSIHYDLRQIYSWIEQAGRGLEYLHDRNIIHRDIKPNNMLLASMDDLKIAYFPGLAREIVIDESITGRIGTDGYTAPEVFTTGNYNNAADIYSFTTTIWEIFHRKKPLDEFKKKFKQHELTTQVINGWRPAIESSLIVPDMKHLLERGWRNDPLQRITFKEILDAVIDVMPPTILALGGINSNKMHLLNRDRTRWSTLLLELPTISNCAGAVHLDGEIYIFGGWELNTKTYKLNREMKWIQLAYMNVERRFDGVSNDPVAFDGCIWVFGGWNLKEALNSVEKYIPGENKWIQMPSMIEKRGDAAAAACKGKLFVSGGMNGCSESRSMECFDPTSQKWTMFLDLPSPMWGHAMISDGICLTVLGGWSEARSVWKIDPNEEKTTWKKLPQMRESRYFFTANLLGDNIFAIGAVGRSKKVEFFNGETWEDGPELPEKLQDMCSIVIPAHLAAALSSHQ